jgi:hypothetical protein
MKSLACAENSSITPPSLTCHAMYLHNNVLLKAQNLPLTFLARKRHLSATFWKFSDPMMTTEFLTTHIFFTQIYSNELVEVIE